MKQKTLKFKRVNPMAKLPARATPKSAGLDLYAPHAMELRAGEHVTIDTGIAIAEELPYWFRVEARSRTWPMKVFTFPGVIESDYRGTLKVGLWNLGDRTIEINQSEGIAQLTVIPLIALEPEEVDELAESERGTQGGINEDIHEL